MDNREGGERSRKGLYSRFTYTWIRRFRGLKGRFVLSVSIPREDAAVIERLEELAALERTTVSALIRKAIKEYVRRHAEGNPQRTIVPRPRTCVNPPLERVRTLLDELEELIRANPGRTLSWIEHIFRRQTGLRPATTREYLRTLAVLGLIKVRGAKVYPRQAVGKGGREGAE